MDTWPPPNEDPRDRRRTRLAPHGYTGCSRQELASILANVREQGYAASHGGGALDISGIAARATSEELSVCVSRPNPRAW